MRNLLYLLALALFFSCSKTSTIWIDEMDLSTAEQGWGEAKAKKNVEGSGPITIAGKVFERGFGTHAQGYFVIDLKENATRFIAQVGIDDAAKKYDKTGATCVFRITLDEETIYTSPKMKLGDSALAIDVDVSGGKILKLIVENAGDGSHGDHADWADARLIVKEKGEKPVPAFAVEMIEEYILTPKEENQPQINGADIYGAGAGKPFLYRIPASGDRPMNFKAMNLPAGLTLDAKTGIIKGTTAKKGTYTTLLIAENTHGSDSLNFDIVIGDTLSLTPPMGWNSWNAYGLNIDEQKVMDVADAFEKTGLINYGWSYINIDDGWESEQRNANGSISTNMKFKNIKALSDNLHARGLKFGIYSSPGPRTCGDYLGSYEHEAIDAKTYASWGVDYLKYDWCSYATIAPANPTLDDYKKPYIHMKSELLKTNRDILFSLCQYGMGEVWKWGEEAGGQLWRTTGDIVDTWGSLQGILKLQEGTEQYAGPGHWNDPDMLIVGYVGWGDQLRKTRLNVNEQYLHISAWAMLASPLLLGCDPLKLDEFTLSLLKNNEVIAINQDRLGVQASIAKKDELLWYYVKPLRNKEYAVCVINFGWLEREAVIDPSALDLNGKYAFRDVWRKQNNNTEGMLTTKIAPHGCVLYRLSPQ